MVTHHTIAIALSLSIPPNEERSKTQIILPKRIYPILKNKQKELPTLRGKELNLQDPSHPVGSKLLG